MTQFQPVVACLMITSVFLFFVSCICEDKGKVHIVLMSIELTLAATFLLLWEILDAL